ncbi:MAG: hypothetical protein ACTSWL_07125 [Promethearchaeota archaeon]
MATENEEKNKLEKYKGRIIGSLKAMESIRWNILIGIKELFALNSVMADSYIKIDKIMKNIEMFKTPEYRTLKLSSGKLNEIFTEITQTMKGDNVILYR